MFKRAEIRWKPVDIFTWLFCEGFFGWGWEMQTYLEICHQSIFQYFIWSGWKNILFEIFFFFLNNCFLQFLTVVTFHIKSEIALDWQEFNFIASEWHKKNIYKKKISSSFHWTFSSFWFFCFPLPSNIFKTISHSIQRATCAQ